MIQTYPAKNGIISIPGVGTPDYDALKAWRTKIFHHYGLLNGDIERSRRMAKQEEKMLKRFSDVDWGDRVQVRQFETPEERLNQDLQVNSWRQEKGDFGPFMVLDCTDLATGEKFELSTGARTVVQRLNIAAKEGLLPMIGRFVRHGRSIDIE